MAATTRMQIALRWLPRLLVAVAILVADFAVPVVALAQEREQQSAQKVDTAHTVLVVGDFLAGGLAEGLEQAFEGRSDVRIVDRTNGSSGFVRDDYYDWPGQIESMLEAEKPAAVVVMIGSNDRQEIGNEAVLSPEWISEYESRIEEFTAPIEEFGIPTVWMGMPAFKSSTMSSGMLAFNDIYRRAAEALPGGVFVDIWDGFVDENGNFTISGPDINGQTVQLRSRDGINLTRDGRRKVAFYAEKPLERILTEVDMPVAEFFGPPIPPDLGMQTSALPQVDRTMPLSLEDPALDGGGELLGGTSIVQPVASSATPVSETKANEVFAPPPPGRADNFRLRQDPRRLRPVSSTPQG